jgi:hypothetical protein
VDCGNGTVTDTQTGLIWLKDASCWEIPMTNPEGKASFHTANDGAALLEDGMCGLTDGSSAGDWRLASLGCEGTAGGDCSFAVATGEFASIFAQPSCGAPYIPDTAGTGCWSEGDPFIGVQSDHYWSSTSFVSTLAVHAHLYGFHVYTSSVDNSMYVWPVRGDCSGCP